jgi:hypothetical protein
LPPEQRAGLSGHKPRRPHPASPGAAADRYELAAARASDAPPSVQDRELVMLCVRVTPSLRRRLKLVAVSSGRPVQALAAEALDAACRQHDM